MTKMCVSRNAIIILKTWFVFSGGIFSTFSVLLSFFTWEEVGIESSWIKLIFFVLTLLVMLMAASVWVCCIRRRNSIWRRGTGEIVLCYDDIIKIAFSKKKQKDKIVVIPVNTCFDMQIDQSAIVCQNPLVAPNTLHGKWIKSMNESGFSIEYIDNMIEKFLALNAVKPVRILDPVQKTRGKLKCYANGTTVLVQGNNGVLFFLIAISQFDKNNVARSSKEKIKDSLRMILELYNSKGQGHKLYIPLLGTGLSRTGMSHEEALEVIKTTLQYHCDMIHGQINVVLYNKDKDKISIFD